MQHMRHDRNGRTFFFRGSPQALSLSRHSSQRTLTQGYVTGWHPVRHLPLHNTSSSTVSKERKPRGIHELHTHIHVEAALAGLEVDVQHAVYLSIIAVAIWLHTSGRRHRDGVARRHARLKRRAALLARPGNREDVWMTLGEDLNSIRLERTRNHLS